jgi:excinuclease UvrABC nuclease subunit
MPTRFDALREQASFLPPLPGVYFWIAADDRILYVGKAVNIRSRVGSYFSAARHDRRVREMLSESSRLEHEVTETELAALLRESALIKQEQPPYNRLLLNARRSYYLRLDRSRQDPYLEISHDRDLESATHFGPFPSARVARETLNFLHDVLPLRKCSVAKPRCSSCPYFQMQTCAAPMISSEHRRRHEEAIDSLHDLLEGRHDRVRAWLKAKRDRLSTSLLFEQAGDIQERLKILQDHERHFSLLEAAARSRCVVIRAGLGDQARFLLVAKGQVVSVRDSKGLDLQGLVQWVTAHEGVMRLVDLDQSELDGAAVLERWLRTRQNQLRWVVIPELTEKNDLALRLSYVASEPDEREARAGKRKPHRRRRYRKNPATKLRRSAGCSPKGD